MKTDELLKDPVFQLNLLLWMVKEQPNTGYRVRPLYYEKGFRIIYIEQPFAMPEETIGTINDSKLDISTTPEPELILGREADNKALYFEAKANSFGTESSNCIQARAHLIACGPAFGEVLAPLKECLLCYLVPDNARELMSECLASLKKELMKKGLKPGPFSSHGLAIKDSKIVYSWNGAFKTHIGIDEDSIPIVDDVEENTDPSPLILAYSDEDCANEGMRDFYRRVIIDQIRATLLCDLHAHSVGAQYETTPDKLLEKTTDRIFQYLSRQRQKGLRRLIRHNVLKKIHDHWKDKQSGIRLANNQLTITWSVIGEKEDFLNWLEDKRINFDASKPSEESSQLSISLGSDSQEE
jgi:hypothetical protein